MKLIEIIQIVLFFGLGIALTPPVGRFMAKVFKGERTFLHPIFQPIEKLIYRLTGIDPAEEMTWLKYFWAVMLFACVGFAVRHGDLHDPEVVAAQSAGPAQLLLGPGVHAGLELHVQRRLAVLLGRGDDELFVAELGFRCTNS